MFALRVLFYAALWNSDCSFLVAHVRSIATHLFRGEVTMDASDGVSYMLSPVLPGVLASVHLALGL